MEAVLGEPGYLATSGIRAGGGGVSPGGKARGDEMAVTWPFPETTC